jgi:hypothetical protein
LVVVFFRAGWGGTKWTRIEEAAIRNRAFEEGYEFAIFVLLDEQDSTPKWLPRTRIWVDYGRWGAKGAASVIEARIRELGGDPHQETVVERAARLERATKFAARREAFLSSVDGVGVACAEFENVCQEIEHLVAEVNESTDIYSLTAKQAKDKIVVVGQIPGLSISWQCPYSNSVRDARLFISLWRGHPPFPGIAMFPPTEIRHWEFTFDLLQSEETGWLAADAHGRTYSSTDLASHALQLALDLPGETKRGSVNSPGQHEGFRF